MEKSLSGKKICFLGSSVTYGFAANGVSFADILAEKYGCFSVKYAVNGTTLVDNGADSYVSLMKNIDKAQRFDLFVCQLSTNDASRNMPLGKVGDASPETVCGAINFIAEYVKNNFGCPLVFYTNPYYKNERYKIMVNNLLDIAKARKFAVIDLYNDRAFNDITPEKRREFMADDIHPTLKGYSEGWTPIFAKRLSEILK